VSDYTLPLDLTLVCGMSSSGKTTFCLRYLLNASAACRFLFDFKGEYAKRLGLPHASTSAQLEAALASRWVVFNPHPMFQGDLQSSFRFFCEWAYQCAKRGPGKKVVHVDELWLFSSPNSIPKELQALAQMGRAEGVELLASTQTPQKIHASITGQSTELVCFRLDERLALDAVQELGAERETVQNLPLGSFVALNRVSRGRLAGRVF